MISGLVNSDSRGNYYYYSFMAGPGEVAITLTVEPGRAPNDAVDFYEILTGVDFSLFDRNAAEIAGKSVITSQKADSKQAVARVEVTRRQLMTLSVHIQNGPYRHTSVGGKYRIRIEGAVELGQSGSTTRPTDTDVSDCLPKQGTLIIKMKDGSKKIIDLSDAETITIVP
jgi:hypothetical protein